MMDLRQHYKDVRARLMIAPAAQPVVILPAPKPPAQKPKLPAPLPKVAAGAIEVVWPPRGKPIIRHLIAAAAEKYGVSASDIVSPSQKRVHCFPRFEVMYRAVEAGHSLPRIGREVGRDHTSVLNGHKRFKALLAEGKVTL